MDRIIQGRSATLTHTFTVDGVATDPSPDTATISITRDDGTILVAPGTATTEAGVGTVTFTLTPTQTAQLDTLTVTWEATFGGQPQTYRSTVEIAGDVLFTIAQARAISALASTVTYPTAVIVAARTRVETMLEHECGVAFVARYAKATLSGNGTRTISLPPRTTNVRSVHRDGVMVSAGELAAIRLMATGQAYNPAGWAAGFGNYAIAYEHGDSGHPDFPAASAAALAWATDDLTGSSTDDRIKRFSEDGQSFEFAAPGVGAANPVVAAFITSHNFNCMVA
ncbi:MAG: hypothetical protein V4703_12875 [Actinomycetota bacterium]